MSDETVRTPRHVLLEETLTSILEALRARPPSPFTRELFAEAERYRHVIAGWNSRPPTDHQRAAMFDCVVSLRAKVAEGASLSLVPEPPPPSSAPASYATRRDVRKVSR